MADTRSGRGRGPQRAPRGDPQSSSRATSQAGLQEPAPRAGTSAVVSRAAGAPAGWVQLTAFGLSLAALAVSIYLTVEHYTAGSSLACPQTSAFNCAKVTTSPQSVVFGIPVAVLGLAFYVFMTAINSPVGWRSPWPALRTIRLLAAVAGIAFVMYLIYAELLVIRSICLWCTSVHVITFALFVLIVFSAAGAGNASARRG